MPYLQLQLNSLSFPMFSGRERERGIMGILRVKLAAKLLVISWSVMKKKEMFAYERLNNC